MCRIVTILGFVSLICSSNALAMQKGTSDSLPTIELSLAPPMHPRSPLVAALAC